MICSGKNGCGKDLDIESFGWFNNSKNKRKKLCRKCTSKKDKLFYEKNKKSILNKRPKKTNRKNKNLGFASPREYSLWKKYKITLEGYDILAESQNGKCAICENKEGILCVDHCHKSGEIRGLLCSNCNAGIGLLGDTKEALLKAYAYLN